MKTKNTSFWGQGSWANMTSHGGKVTALACHPHPKSKQSIGTRISLQALFFTSLNANFINRAAIMENLVIIAKFFSILTLSQIYNKVFYFTAIGTIIIQG